jgi:hypothetical protein
MKHNHLVAITMEAYCDSDQTESSIFFSVTMDGAENSKISHVGRLRIVPDQRSRTISSVVQTQTMLT